MSAFITDADIDEIAVGAAVLGTGGGGDPHVGSLMAKRLIRLHGPVRLLAVEELTDDDFVVPVGGIGAPSVSVERIMAESELTAALEAIERAVGRKPTAVMPIEVGGGNSMIPIAAAALAGLPVVDGDAMGRAFPEAQMVTFHLAGYGPGATVLVDHFGNEVVSRPVNGEWSERLARAAVVEMGGGATMIDYAYGGDVVRECAIPGTLTLAKRIGSILRGRSATGDELRDDERIDALCDDLGAYRLFDGKVSDLQREVDGGFTRGAAELDGVGGDRGATFRLDFQNEMLLARRDGQIAAVTPDLIAVLDLATGMPITTDDVRYGARVTVIGIPCDDRWRTPMGLATAGPDHFGYDVDWVPVEQFATQKEGR
ncbi:DUF917 family protein [Microbacterium keratanolyticum]|uniref:DUF917 domain-containing protein n=1 Tax=Microbacterium keratanolyticum TaxID=67574 RepID=A0A9W6HPZ1_9MICO|nr:DUF917 domain-containing protein [Microbacterium keratanolyticum]MBM7468628.1 DUF917 family protein [Microbacterium keratanolyticum]GLK00703.1 hypothetical protein GCM10017596_04180 [Microbacterium keratanolyticum]